MKSFGVKGDAQGRCHKDRNHAQGVAWIVSAAPSARLD